MTSQETIRDFLKTHHAVRSGVTGLPDWKRLDDEALVEWFKSYHSLVINGLVKTGHADSWGPIMREATPEERAEGKPIFDALKDELIRRHSPYASFTIQAAMLVYLPK